jgi:hypothetical protein
MLRSTHVIATNISYQLLKLLAIGLRYLIGANSAKVRQRMSIHLLHKRKENLNKVCLVGLRDPGQCAPSISKKV